MILVVVVFGLFVACLWIEVEEDDGAVDVLIVDVFAPCDISFDAVTKFMVISL